MGRQFKILFFTFLFVVSALAGLAQTGHLGGMCPVMPGHKVKEKFFTEYEGERIYFCCRSCIRAFKKNPQKYFKHD